jgi:fumarylacetoacetase
VTLPLKESWHWTSWIAAANVPGCGFPLQNLPYCVFEADDAEPHLGVGIGDQIFDLRAAAGSGCVDKLPIDLEEVCCAPELNSLMARGDGELRGFLMLALRSESPQRPLLQRFLRPMAGATFYKPVRVGDYTDFYASLHHAERVGRLFRPDAPLLPNYKWIPIGYHGRASSLVVSGTQMMRPHGQIKQPDATAPVFAPSRQLDYELEVAAYVRTANHLGEPVPIDRAEEHLFGVSLLNDWSARDVQSWEYQPLGPFLGKSFATSISPWVVSLHALAPFRCPLEPRAAADPLPLPYLHAAAPESAAIDLQLEVHLTTPAMRAASLAPAKLSQGNIRHMYWSFAQMLAHHTSNGCNLQVGDLLASGTISGPEQGSEGCLLEMTRRGTLPLRLPNGETRSFLEDGDEVVLTGFCERDGLPRITLGECRGEVAPALARHP